MINWTAVLVTIIICMTILCVFRMSFINEERKRDRVSKTFIEQIAKEAKKHE